MMLEVCFRRGVMVAVRPLTPQRSFGSSCFKARQCIETAFFAPDHYNSLAHPHPSAVLAKATAAVVRVRADAPKAAVTSSGQLHEMFPDFAAYFLSELPRGFLTASRFIDGTCAFPPCQASTEHDAMEYFITKWLPVFLLSGEAVPSVAGEGFALSAFDLCCAIDAFKRYVLPQSLDAGRWSMRAMPGLWSPTTVAEERMCVPLLHWLKDSCSQHAPPRVMHVGCGSGGYVTDLILKGCRTASLLCVDHSRYALDAVEDALQQHWSMKRSSHVGRHVEVAVSPLLPSFTPPAPQAVDPVRGGSAGRGCVGVDAAARRRKLGRAHRSGVLLENDRLERTNQAVTSLLQLPVDILLVTASPGSVEGYPCWSPLQAVQQPSWVLHDAPYASQAGVERWVAHCLSAQYQLSPSGVVCAQLPFNAALGSRPGDAIAQALRSHNERRRATSRSVPYEMLLKKSSVMCPTAADVAGLVSDRRTQKFLLRCGPRDPLQQRMFVKAFEHWVSHELGVEMVVLGPALSASANYNSYSVRDEPPDGCVTAWEDTFEHQHYLPKEGPTNPFHWTNLISTFPHLDENVAAMRPVRELTLADRQRLFTQRNDTSAAMGTSSNVMAINRAAESNLHALFGHELRAQRVRRAKKLAFASPRNVEWYLDEKVVKSEAARVDIMNEVLKKLGGARPN